MEAKALSQLYKTLEFSPSHTHTSQITTTTSVPKPCHSSPSSGTRIVAVASQEDEAEVARPELAVPLRLPSQAERQFRKKDRATTAIRIIMLSASRLSPLEIRFVFAMGRLAQCTRAAKKIQKRFRRFCIFRRVFLSKALEWWTSMEVANNNNVRSETSKSDIFQSSCSSLLAMKSSNQHSPRPARRVAPKDFHPDGDADLVFISELLAHHHHHHRQHHPVVSARDKYAIVSCRFRELLLRYAKCQSLPWLVAQHLNNTIPHPFHLSFRRFLSVSCSSESLWAPLLKGEYFLSFSSAGVGVSIGSQRTPGDPAGSGAGGVLWSSHWMRRYLSADPILLSAPPPKPSSHHRLHFISSSPSTHSVTELSEVGDSLTGHSKTPTPPPVASPRTSAPSHPNVAVIGTQSPRPEKITASSPRSSTMKNPTQPLEIPNAKSCDSLQSLLPPPRSTRMPNSQSMPDVQTYSSRGSKHAKIENEPSLPQARCQTSHCPRLLTQRTSSSRGGLPAAPISTRLMTPAMPLSGSLPALSDVLVSRRCPSTAGNSRLMSRATDHSSLMFDDADLLPTFPASWTTSRTSSRRRKRSVTCGNAAVHCVLPRQGLYDLVVRRYIDEVCGRAAKKSSGCSYVTKSRSGKKNNSSNGFCLKLQK